ncbi:oligopeptide transporter ATP-binding component [Raoultella terrigena]|uniref:Oligopeptide transporter ATP-binding component n=1 Tax=Raoultella terrigena TaxID=577 RepID=A0A4U9CUI0_RAOTE|nr:oligopeptide transporter ATP-binding component [Raoultella terrigena]
MPGERRRRLYSIPGQVPDLAALPPYCAFADRCARASERCRQGIPPLAGDVRQVACFHPELAEVVGMSSEYVIGSRRA